MWKQWEAGNQVLRSATSGRQLTTLDARPLPKQTCKRVLPAAQSLVNEGRGCRRERWGGSRKEMSQGQAIVYIPCTAWGLEIRSCGPS